MIYRIIFLYNCIIYLYIASVTYNCIDICLISSTQINIWWLFVLFSPIVSQLGINRDLIFITILTRYEVFIIGRFCSAVWFGSCGIHSTPSRQLFMWEDKFFIVVVVVYKYFMQQYDDIEVKRSLLLRLCTSLLIITLWIYMTHSHVSIWC